MFGKNPTLKPETGDGKTLKVTKIFPTIQGEGPASGRPAIFVRLHGCHLRCYFCDTEFSNPEDRVMKVEEIVEEVKSFSENGVYKLVVLTGGEPTRQPLNKLIPALISEGYEIHIETAGSFWQDILNDEAVSIIVSPKTSFVNENIARKAKAFKYVISHGKISADDGLPFMSTQKREEIQRLYRARKGCPVYLSPMDEYDELKNQRNRELVAMLAQKFGYTAQLQIHKLMGVE